MQYHQTERLTGTSPRWRREKGKPRAHRRRGRVRSGEERGNARRSPTGPSPGRQGRRRPLGAAPPPEQQEWPELVPCLPGLDSSAAAAREMESGIHRGALLVAPVLSASARADLFFLRGNEQIFFFSLRK